MTPAPHNSETAFTATGLSTQAAQHRLLQDGYNELYSSTRRRTIDIALSVVREPMFLLLIVAAVIYLTLGDVREALVLAFWILVIMGITIFQERKTERALEALRDLSSPRALVIRDGEQKRIAGREVVRDDCLIITEGDRVPADAVLLSCNDLMVDESLLSGESVPVRKAVWDGVQEVTRPGGDDLPFVFAGTMLVQGRGVARVVATGPRTEMGRIGKALPAMGYSPAQFEDLSATINATPCDSIVVATPVDLARLISLDKPHCRVRYDLEEISRPDLFEVISDFLRTQPHSTKQS